MSSDTNFNQNLFNAVTMNALIVTIIILLYGMTFILGFVVGRITGNQTSSQIDSKGSFFKPEVRQRKHVEIDEKKFVTTVSTDTLERKGKDLGVRTVVEDDVSAAASKLAMLKKK